LLAFVVHRPHAPPLPPPPTAAMSTEVGELQEQLLALEEDLTRREATLVMQEEKANISEKDLVKVSANLDAEWAKIEDTRK
jgi:hypothetical protein